MAVHPVLGPDGQPLEVPVADDGLPGVRLGEAAVVAHRLGDPGQLGGGRDVADEHPARQQRVGDDAEALPGREHVEHDTIDARRAQPTDGSDSTRSPTVTVHAGWSAPKNARALAWAMVAKSARRSKDSSRPSPTARSRDIDNAPEPTPASTTTAPGKMSAIVTI
jgi:hypothetical protein